jgi:hypothetical protein
MSEGRIRCGGCQGRHDAVEAVRACCAGSEIWRCEWLVRAGRTEDGDEIIRECGAESWEMPGGRGYECACGHSHVNAEFRRAEGWDYASDAEEAWHMRKYGLDAVGPDGASI